MDELKLSEVYPVTSHTDFVGKGTTFVAIPGTHQDGTAFIPVALKKGATTIVIQEGMVVDLSLKKMIYDYSAQIKVVKNARESLSLLAAQALDFPSKKLKIIGITGTKGKTSTSYMLYYMLLGLGKKVALSSTVEKLIGKLSVKIPLTTPLPDQLHMFLDMCVKHDIEYVVLEVSAQSLSLSRLVGIEFEAGLFTNFSMEHLEFYKNMQEYFEAKSLLVDQVKDKKKMFINIDDHYGSMLEQSKKGCSSFSLENKDATIYGLAHFKEKHILLHAKIAQKTYMYHVPLLGKFNAYNMLGALGVMYTLGIDLQDLMLNTLQLKAIPGRMEQYTLKNNARCFIDYAHNPSSFEAVLSTLRTMTDNLIVVFGAGGCRDKQKRPLMGSVAQKYSDIIVLTSDNPRDEDPAAIANDIEQGFKKASHVNFYKELNRTKAIEFSYTLSKEGSIIAILGKGSDEYQIVGDLTFPFKERAIIKKFLSDS